MPRKGYKQTKEHTENLKKSHFGIVFSEKHKRNIGKSLIGRKLSKETIEKIRKSNSGKKRSEETKRKTGIASRNRCAKEKHWNWQGGITPRNVQIRGSLEYKLWRKSVFERDGYTCIWCFHKGGKLHADHIKPFALFPELRFAIDNGRTLCVPCHRKTDTYGNKSKRVKTRSI